MKNVYDLEVFNDKNITASAIIIGTQPKHSPYIKVNIYDKTGLIMDMAVKDKDIERFALNILKALKSKHLQTKNKQ